MTTPLDEKGLEAARVAFYGGPGAGFTNPPLGALEVAIRAYLTASSPIQADGLRDRLRPSAVVDETPGLAVTMLRRLDMPALADRLNAWIVENNDIKSKAQSALTAMQGERDEADNALVDKYRDQKTGIFKFPGDVAAIIRRLDAAESEVKRLTEEKEGLAELVQAVAHIGVDFGYGPYILEDKHVEFARSTLQSERSDG